MARGATARLFVAVDPPQEACAELARWAREAVAVLRAWGPPRPRRPPRVLAAESLHLTLCFLGSRPVAEIGPLAGALRGLAGEVGELAVGAPLWLPPRRPRALAVEVSDPAGALPPLHSALVGALEGESSWEPERRRLRPHVTLVRTRAAPGPHAIETLPATPRLRFTPEALVLYRSRPTPAGSVYEAIERSVLTRVA